MPAPHNESHPQPPVLELKSSSFTLPILKLFGSDMDAIGDQLARIVEQAPPDFFRCTPVVVDLTALVMENAPFDLSVLISLCRDRGMRPIGVRGGGKTQSQAAEAAGIAVLAEHSPAANHKPREPKQRTQPQPKPEPEATPAANTVTRLITHPVRSGQRVHAQGGDLIVTAQVSHGAEVIADGNIHIYGTLRGRALAGAKGDTSSRIFCRDLQAELIAIAGHYQLSENLDDSVRGIPVQAFLDNLSLMIRPL